MVAKDKFRDNRDNLIENEPKIHDITRWRKEEEKLNSLLCNLFKLLTASLKGTRLTGRIFKRQTTYSHETNCQELRRWRTDKTFPILLMRAYRRFNWRAYCATACKENFWVRKGRKETWIKYFLTEGSQLLLGILRVRQERCWVQGATRMIQRLG